MAFYNLEPRERDDIIMTKEEFIKNEQYLKLNKTKDFVLNFEGKLEIIDFHTHMGNALPFKRVDANAKGNQLNYKTLPDIKDLDLSVPYWTKVNLEEKKKGLFSLIKFSLEGYGIYKDMSNGGTYENCFKSQDENMIKKNVVLPLSTKKSDCSLEAMRVVKDYPDRFIAFCSVHPHDHEMKEKVYRYKAMGFKGLKLKITDMELKNDFKSLIDLLKICYEVEFPVLLHTGSLTYIKRQNTSNIMWKILQSTRVEIFGELLKELPVDFKFIFGHSGIQEYKLVAHYLKKHPSCYAELSCQSVDSIKYLINEVGYERLLFGSDWPALPQGITLSRVLLATEGNNEAREHILYKNAKQILDI